MAEAKSTEVDVLKVIHDTLNFLKHNERRRVAKLIKACREKDDFTPSDEKYIDAKSQQLALEYKIEGIELVLKAINEASN